MIAVITGDLINSRQSSPNIWMPDLKAVLDQYGESPKTWELFRGDSFQLKTSTEKVLLCAMHLKAAMRQHSNLDLRMGIGMGEESYGAENITESNGSAYLHSGEAFELTAKQNLVLSSGNEERDDLLNLVLELFLLTADQWSKTVATTVQAALEHPDLAQIELGALLNKSQSSISEALKRGAFDELLRLNAVFQKQFKSEP